MNRLILNEAKKQGIMSLIITAIIIFIVLNLMGKATMGGYTLQNWREKAQGEKIENEEIIEHMEHEIPSSENEAIKRSCQLAIEEIDYCLKNDIPYGVISVGGYMFNINGMDTFVFLIIIVFVARIISIENENKTWKNLYTTPVDKKKIVLSKICFSGIIVIGVTVVFFLISFLCSIIFCGTDINEKVRVWSSEQYEEKSLLVNIAIMIIIFIVKALFYSMFTLVISVITNKNYIMYLIPLLLLLFGDILETIISQYKIHKFLPFKYLYSTVDNIFFESNFLLKTCLALVPFIMLFMIGVILIFNKKKN